MPRSEALLNTVAKKELFFFLASNACIMHQKDQPDEKKMIFFFSFVAAELGTIMMDAGIAFP